MGALSFGFDDPFAVGVVRWTFCAEPPASPSAFLLDAMPFAGLVDRVVVLGFSPVMEARRSPICRDDTGQLILGLRRLGLWKDKVA